MLKSMVKPRSLFAVLALCVALTVCGCSSASEGGETSSSSVEEAQSGSSEGASQALPSESEEPADREDASAQVPEAAFDDVSMRNVALGAVPDGYYSAAERQGTLETFTYDTKNYIGSGADIRRNATVYLPYGYDQDDSGTKYNILYLQHGAYGDEQTWMYEYGDRFKNMIDHMIEDGSIPPLIIVMPYLSSGNSWYHDTTPIFYSGEIRNDLMPAVEAHYHTYAQDVTDSGFADSRSHRAFGGFSAGGTTTWTVFLEGLDRFEYFMPMSGGLALGGDGSTGDSDSARLADAALASGYGKRAYYVFAATGTGDLAYPCLTAQIESMKSLADAFDFTETGFADGNLMYYTVQGNLHDYPYTYEYVYNGLRCLFSWA